MIPGSSAITSSNLISASSYSLFEEAPSAILILLKRIILSLGSPRFSLWLSLSPGVPAPVVKLGPGRLDELVPRGSQALELAPAIVVAGIKTLAVGFRIPFRVPSPDQRKQALPLDCSGHRQTQQLTESRHKVDVLHLGSDRFSPELGRGNPDDHGNGDRGIIDEESMRALMMLTQALSVVSHAHDHRLLQLAFFPQSLQDPADQVIRIGDLTVVEPVALAP